MGDLFDAIVAKSTPRELAQLLRDMAPFEGKWVEARAEVERLREVLYCARVLDECVDAETLADLSRAVASVTRAKTLAACEEPPK